MACNAMVGFDRCGDDNDVTGTKATPTGASITIVTATTIEDFIAEVEDDDGEEPSRLSWKNTLSKTYAN